MTTDTRTTCAAWFELPTVDFERAIRFYETILDATLRTESNNGILAAVFPYPEGATGGQINAGGRPSADGTTVYLDVTGRLDEVLSRVEAAGGSRGGPVIDLGPIGKIAHILDSEGNRVGLHQPPA